MITFKANTRGAHASTDDEITTESVGIPITLDLSEEFNGLMKTVCFRAGSESADIVLIGDATETFLPVNVLETAGEWLKIGIYAADANDTIVIPTVWANVGVVKQGTLPSGYEPTEPVPSCVAQVEAMAEEALDIAEHAVIPVITADSIPNGTRVTITYGDETVSFDVMNGYCYVY